MRRLCVLLVFFMAFCFFCSPTIVNAGELLVQVACSQNLAKVGVAKIASSNAAVVTVVVTKAGVPVTNAGTSVGNGTGIITLPTGWKLYNPVGPYQILMPIAFSNLGNGIYAISYVLATGGITSGYTPRAWRAGDYHMVFQVKANNLQDQGDGLGVLKIQ
jgi:hypothetical protein